jgi:hypothetical protein
MDTHAAILDTLYRFGAGFDDDDMDAVVACFAEDAEVVTTAGAIAGHAAIREAFKARRDRRTESREQVRHVTTNTRVELAGEDGATARSYFTLVVTGAGGEIAIGSVGTYEDRFVRVGERWLIARRHTRADAVT